MTNQTTRRHPLLRPGRWHLARPQSRALWTAATASELAELFDDHLLRRRVEDFLGVVAGVVDDVETLLVFDHDCLQLALALSLRPEHSTRYAWDWIGRSLVPRLGQSSSSFIRSTAGRVSDEPTAGGRYGT